MLEVLPSQDIRVIQRRTVTVLMVAQVLGSLGVGAALTMGTSLITHVSGNPSISGLAATVGVLGAAIAGIPLAKLASSKGRRIALASGNLIAVLGACIVIAGAAVSSLAIIMIGLTAMGAGSAAQLQSRFAATDLAQPQHQGRDLSLVVWSITLGAVAGPNLVAPGEVLGSALGMPILTGAFLITASAQALALLIVLLFLQPDPLLTAQRNRDEHLFRAEERSADRVATVRSSSTARSRQRTAIVVIAIAQAVMVGVMALTPAHLLHHGYSLTIIGFTISLHIAGMYALAPVFGILVDKFGAIRVIVFGGIQLGIATAFTGFGAEDPLSIQLGLILLGTGWSAATVAGSALLTASTPLTNRTKMQGRSDALMNFAGASAGALGGLAFAVGGFVALSAIAALFTAVMLGVVLSLFLRQKSPQSDN